MQKPDQHISKPWYREPWPWILFGIPAFTLVGGVIMYIVAANSNDGLVVDDYYKQGLGINQTLARGELAKAMDLQANVKINAQQVILHLTAKEGVTLPPRISINLAHATRTHLDVRVLLQREEGSKYYSGNLPNTPIAGHWHIVLEDEAKQWRLATKAELPLASNGLTM